MGKEKHAPSGIGKKKKKKRKIEENKDANGMEVNRCLSENERTFNERKDGEGGGGSRR